MFAHQDGRPYGSPKPEPSVRDDVTSAMRNMGWDKPTTRAALHHAGRASI